MDLSTPISKSFKALIESQEILKKRISDFDSVSDKAIELVFNNKITSKNAFDVNIQFIPDISAKMDINGESTWEKASSTLYASSKIYGYRVDAVHSQTFSFLSGLAREAKLEEAYDENEEGINVKIESAHSDNRIRGGDDTIERDLKKLNLTEIEKDFNVDPLFHVMNRLFNDEGSGNLLTMILPIDRNLNMLLESEEQYQIKSSKEELSVQFVQQLNNLDVSGGMELSQGDQKQILNQIEEALKLPVIEVQNTNTIRNIKKRYELFNPKNEEDFLKRLMSSDDSNKNLSFNFFFSLNEDDDSDYQNIENNDIVIEQEEENIGNLDLVECFNTCYVGNVDKPQVSLDVVRSECLEENISNSNLFKDQFFSLGNGSKTALPLNLNQLQLKSLNYLSSIKKSKQSERLNIKVSKENKMFDFSENALVDADEVFAKNKQISKRKSAKIKSESDYQFLKRKRKLNAPYNFDYEKMISLFNIGDKFAKKRFDFEEKEEEPNCIDVGECSRNEVEEDENDYSYIEIQQEENYHISNQAVLESNESNQTHHQKKKKVISTNDVKQLKGQLLSTLKNSSQSTLQDNYNNENLNECPSLLPTSDFNNMVESLETKLCPGSALSKRLSFVCLLHLANENKVFLEPSQTIYNFFVKFNYN